MNYISYEFVSFWVLVGVYSVGAYTYVYVVSYFNWITDKNVNVAISFSSSLVYNIHGTFEIF